MLLKTDGEAVGRTEKVKATLELNRFEEEDRIETVPSKCLQAPDIDLQTLGWGGFGFPHRSSFEKNGD